VSPVIQYAHAAVIDTFIFFSVLDCPSLF